MKITDLDGKVIEMNDRQVNTHASHCCILHGCKYGPDETCPVCRGYIKQKYPCEECDDYQEKINKLIDEQLIVDIENEIYNKMEYVPPVFREDMLDAIKVQFLGTINDEDFFVRGLKGWLTGVRRCENLRHWEIYIDLTEFQEENEKYFRPVYYDSDNQPTLTARECGEYRNKNAIPFGDFDNGSFESQMEKYFKILK